MSKKLIVAVLAVAFVAACAKKEEVMVTEPVTAEPVYQGKL
ncbi:MAG: hypothetical protein RLZZ528_2028 [Pseudomonadota bacterium]|jgi:uncharacterized lipoprotein YajG